MPQQRGFEGSGTTKNSVYKLDFSERIMPQIMIRRPKTSFDNDNCLSTTYRYAHGNDNPHKSTLNAMCNAAFTKPEMKPPKMRSLGRESVASCMSWYVPKPATSNYEVPPHYRSRTGATPASTQIYSAEAAQSKMQQPQSFTSTLSSDISTVISSSTAAPAPVATPAAAVQPTVATPAAVAVPSASAPASVVQSKTTLSES